MFGCVGICVVQPISFFGLKVLFVCPSRSVAGICVRRCFAGGENDTVLQRIHIRYAATPAILGYVFSSVHLAAPAPFAALYLVGLDDILFSV